MRKIILAIVASSLPCAAQAQAQTATASTVSESIGAPVAERKIILPPNTEVVVTPNDTITSKSVKVGDKFRIATTMDVVQDGFVVIPRGTVGEGTISYRTGKGAFGKSAKIEVVFNWLDLNGRRIPLLGSFRQEGEGNTGAAVGAVVAVGVFGAFVTGRSANITNGQLLRAHTGESVAFVVPATAVPIPTATLAAPTPIAAITASTTAVAQPATKTDAGH